MTLWPRGHRGLIKTRQVEVEEPPRSPALSSLMANFRATYGRVYGCTLSLLPLRLFNASDAHRPTERERERGRKRESSACGHHYFADTMLVALSLSLSLLLSLFLPSQRQAGRHCKPRREGRKEENGTCTGQPAVRLIAEKAAYIHPSAAGRPAIVTAASSAGMCICR